VSSAAAEDRTPEDPEDLKLITLARAALGRSGGTQGAAVRDTEGRAYAAANVELTHLKLSAVAVAVAMGVSSGAEGLDAVAVAGVPPSEDDFDLLRDVAVAGAVIWLTDTHGTVQSMTELR
jgi:hypothetical protein